MQLTPTKNICPRCGCTLRITCKEYHICNNCGFDEGRIEFMMFLLGYKYRRIKNNLSKKK